MEHHTCTHDCRPVTPLPFFLCIHSQPHVAVSKRGALCSLGVGGAGGLCQHCHVSCCLCLCAGSVAFKGHYITSHLPSFVFFSFILTGVIIAMKVNVETFGWNDWGMLFALYEQQANSSSTCY